MPFVRQTHRALAVICTVTGAVAACGSQAPAAGGPCRPSANVPSCADPTGRLTCRAFTWRRDPCRGPGGCAVGHCDQTLAETGDDCDAEGTLACSVDGKELLRCTGGAMVAATACRGEHGCYRKTPDSAPQCDIGDPEVGDPCEVDGARCSADGKTVIGCGPTSRHYALQKNCRGQKGCFQFSAFALAEQARKKECSLGFVACDVSVGDVGEPCDGKPAWGRPCLPGDHCLAGTTRIAASSDGGFYCSSDGKQELECKNDTLVPLRSCSACTVTWAPNEEHYEVDCKPDSPASAGRGGRAIGVVHTYPPEHS